MVVKLKKSKIALISLLYIALIVFVFLYLSGSPPFYRAVPLTISQLCSNPEIWVGKKVSLQGILRGPLAFIPEEVPPYSYLLEAPNTLRTIGVLWKDYSNVLEEKNVTVVGFVRKGDTRPLIVRTVYYIEAETIELWEK